MRAEKVVKETGSGLLEFFPIVAHLCVTFSAFTNDNGGNSVRINKALLTKSKFSDFPLTMPQRVETATPFQFAVNFKLDGHWAAARLSFHTICHVHDHMRIQLILAIKRARDLSRIIKSPCHILYP